MHGLREERELKDLQMSRLQAETRRLCHAVASQSGRGHGHGNERAQRIAAATAALRERDDLLALQSERLRRLRVHLGQMRADRQRWPQPDAAEGSVPGVVRATCSSDLRSELLARESRLAELEEASSEHAHKLLVEKEEYEARSAALRARRHPEMRVQELEQFVSIQAVMFEEAREEADCRTHQLHALQHSVGLSTARVEDLRSELQEFDVSALEEAHREQSDESRLVLERVHDELRSEQHDSMVKDRLIAHLEDELRTMETEARRFSPKEHREETCDSSSEAKAEALIDKAKTAVLHAAHCEVKTDTMLDKSTTAMLHAVQLPESKYENLTEKARNAALQAANLLKAVRVLPSPDASLGSSPVRQNLAAVRVAPPSSRATFPATRVQAVGSVALQDVTSSSVAARSASPPHQPPWVFRRGTSPPRMRSPPRHGHVHPGGSVTPRHEPGTLIARGQCRKDPRIGVPASGSPAPGGAVAQATRVPAVRRPERERTNQSVPMSEGRALLATTNKLDPVPISRHPRDRKSVV